MNVIEAWKTLQSGESVSCNGVKLHPNPWARESFQYFVYHACDGEMALSDEWEIIKDKKTIVLSVKWCNDDECGALYPRPNSPWTNMKALKNVIGKETKMTLEWEE